jgi:hypothetical protein
MEMPSDKSENITWVVVIEAAGPHRNSDWRGRKMNTSPPLGFLQQERWKQPSEKIGRGDGHTAITEVGT